MSGYYSNVAHVTLVVSECKCEDMRLMRLLAGYSYTK